MENFIITIWESESDTYSVARNSFLFENYIDRIRLAEEHM